MRKLKVVFISTMLPSGHYSQIICSGLSQIKDINLIIYTDKDKRNLDIQKCGKIKTVFSKSSSYIFEIISELNKDKPDIVHLQQEMNMYGSPLTALLFPLLVALIRIRGMKVVVTLHAAVYKKDIDRNFIKLFHQESPFAQPAFLKIIFHWIFALSSHFSHKILIHTHLHEDIFKDYGVDIKKVCIIPDAIPLYKTKGYKKKPYFLYFGYMARRKGLGYALDGFTKYLAENPSSNYKLVLAGGVIKGQEKAFDEIKERIKKNNLGERIEIKGFVEQDQLDVLYGEAYAVIIPAVVSMGSSGPLFHTNGYHKCPIATNVGHFLEDIIPDVTGILTENSNWDKAFDKAVNNPNLIKKIEKNVAKKAAERTPLNTAKQYYPIYKQVLARK